MVSEETLEGLGTTSGFLLQTLFGSIVKIATPPQPGDRSRTKTQTPGNTTESDGATARCHDAASGITTRTTLEKSFPASQSQTTTSTSFPAFAQGPQDHQQNEQLLSQFQREQDNMPFATSGYSAGGIEDMSSRTVYGHTAAVQEILLSSQAQSGGFRLTEYLPEPGYFVAGALAGGISRTATAPLDRLKVYLLVNTQSSAITAAREAQSGKPLTAIRHLGRPVVDAIKDLWHQGGSKTFFAGMLPCSSQAVLSRGVMQVLTLGRKWTKCGENYA